MNFDRERAEGPVITGFSANGFKVEAGEFRGTYRGLTISPIGSDEWAPPPIEALGVDAVTSLLALDPRPEFLLLGTGATMQRPPPSFIRGCEALGVGVEVMDSRAAARAWSVLRGETRWVVGALYPL